MLLVPYMWASMTFLPYMWATLTFWPENHSDKPYRRCKNLEPTKRLGLTLVSITSRRAMGQIHCN